VSKIKGIKKASRQGQGIKGSSLSLFQDSFGVESVSSYELRGVRPEVRRRLVCLCLPLDFGRDGLSQQHKTNKTDTCNVNVIFLLRNSELGLSVCQDYLNTDLNMSLLDVFCVHIVYDVTQSHSHSITP
jgi:hypothetical protein